MLFIETARLNLLPDNARQFVREVQERYHDDHAVEQNATKRLNELGERLFVLDKVFMGGGQITESQAIERKRLQVDHDAASRRCAQMREASRENVQLLAKIDQWLSAPHRTVGHMVQTSTELVDVPLPRPEGDLTAIRGEIVKLTAEHADVRRAPLPHAEIEARIRNRVAEMAKQGRPRLSGFDGNSGFDLIFHATKPQTVLAWFDPEAMVKRLLAELPPAAEGAMSASGKRKRLADIDARKLELERREEALVRATGALRRSDADVRAILSIEERPRQAAAA